MTLRINYRISFLCFFSFCQITFWCKFWELLKNFTCWIKICLWIGNWTFFNFISHNFLEKWKNKKLQRWEKRGSKIISKDKKKRRGESKILFSEKDRVGQANISKTVHFVLKTYRNEVIWNLAVYNYCRSKIFCQINQSRPRGKKWKSDIFIALSSTWATPIFLGTLLHEVEPTHPYTFPNKLELHDSVPLG